MHQASHTSHACRLAVSENGCRSLAIDAVVETFLTLARRALVVLDARREPSLHVAQFVAALTCVTYGPLTLRDALALVVQTCRRACTDIARAAGVRPAPYVDACELFFTALLVPRAGAPPTSTNRQHEHVAPDVVWSFLTLAARGL